MDEGKGTEPKPRWWSRPHLPGRTAGRETGFEDSAQPSGHRAPAVSAEKVPPEPATPPHPDPPLRTQAPAPLHAPDPYGTPPYGRPGPWAPAPPVQRPATPPHGVQLPPAQGVPPGTPAFRPDAPPQQLTAPQPAALSQSPYPQATLRYDPWSLPLAAPKPPRRRRSGGRAGLVLLGLALALVAGVGTATFLADRDAEEEVATGDGAERRSGTVAAIAARALPGVVTIHVEAGGEAGTGTGFALDDRGHLLTNHHVVDGAKDGGTVRITLGGGQRITGEVVGSDPGYDLAVVEIDRGAAPEALPLGDSDAVKVGEPVVAIGAPFGLEATVTSGIISAKNRPVTAGGSSRDSELSYVDALQTDAPINPGNSGGPLVDTDGKVIGINSSIRSAGDGSGTGGSVGLGFAIPVNQGKRVAQELIDKGTASHPVIGVTLDTSYEGQGARVGSRGSVERGGPADRAGVEPGDVIREVDGVAVESAEELIVRVRSHRPGETVELAAERGGKERRFQVRLGSSSGE
ncbi:trypsin-like peptidase domain-containing protein [Streptomyces sulphureus]|uniref:trypsin-like peptidase domain-containing protein n=1 Tax=Streptomyces sulphureus TaxID=47758 RepID=UPI000366780C|nr:trypsin-like peptidase domain-containing protein [Streptomyces sulphureus]